MWKTFESDGIQYMIKAVHNDNLEVHVTDLKEIWSQTLTTDFVLEQFQKNNPGFVVKLEGVVSQIIDFISRVGEENIEIKAVKNCDDVELNLQSQLSNFPIKFDFVLTKGSLEMFFKEITVPLIKTVKTLEQQQSMLSKLIQKKDRELEEYKMENKVISRSDLITEKFDPAVINTLDDKSMLNVFGTEAFWSVFKEQHGDFEPVVDDVKVEPWNHTKRKRKVYSSKTSRKRGKGIIYTE